MKELVKSFFAYGLTSGLSKFISLLLIPIYTRYFTPAQYGIIDLIQSVLVIVMIFGLLQLETSIQRYYYEVKNEEKKEYASTIFWTVTGLSFLLMFVVFVFASQLSLLMFDTDKYANIIRIASVIIPLSNASTISFIVIRYMKKPMLFGVITLLQIIFSASSTIIFVLIFDLGIISVFYGQIVGLLVVNAIQLIFLRHFYKLFWDYTLFKKMLDFALPQFPARIGSTSNVYINRFFMIGMLSTTAIGIFSVALKFASIMGLFLSAFSMAWVPFMYETLNQDNHKEVFANVFKYVCLFVFLLVTGLSFFSKEIIQIFTTPKYYEAYYLLGGLGLYNGLFMIKDVVDLGPRITKKTVYITYVYVLSSILNIALLYAGIKLFDLQGVVWALIFTNLGLIALSWYFSNKLYPIAYNKMYFAVLFILMLLVVIFNIKIDVHLFIKIIAYLLLVGGIGFGFKEEVRSLLNRLKLKK